MTARDALAMAQNIAFVDYIGQAMAERGWTVKQLAEQAGVFYSASFRNVVAGRARAAPKTLARIAPALGVSVGELAKLYGPAARKRVNAGLHERAAMPTVEMVNAQWGANAPSPKVTVKSQQVTFSKFSMTLADDGTMRVTLDLSELHPEAAFGLAEYLRANGLLSKENT
jgi:transcriptional regulator with XRE-family HTH domain